jgi:hypothetical protein
VTAPPSPSKEEGNGKPWYAQWHFAVPGILLNLILLPLICIGAWKCYHHMCPEEDHSVKAHEQEIPLWERHKNRAADFTATSDMQDRNKSMMSKRNQTNFCVAKIQSIAKGLVVIEFDARGDNTVGKIPDADKAQIWVDSKSYDADPGTVTYADGKDPTHNVQGIVKFFPRGEVENAKIEFQYANKWSRVTLQEKASKTGGGATVSTRNEFLTVEVIRGSNIPRVVMGVQDPYMSLYVTRKGIEDWSDANVRPKDPFGKTKNAPNPSEPVWGETFRTPLHADSVPNGGQLEFFCFDYPTSAFATSTFIGWGCLSLDECKIEPGAPLVDRVVDLNDGDPRKKMFGKGGQKARGQIFVKVGWCQDSAF